MIRKIWKVFGSLKFSLVLMLVLIGLTLIGTFIIQVPAEYTQDAADYEYWLDNFARPDTGIWYSIMHFLGFFDVFHSIWFLGTGALLVLSIIVCSINRWKHIWSEMFARSFPEKAEDYITADSTEITIPPVSDPRSRLLKVLRRLRFTINSAVSGSNLYIVISKNRFSPLGTYLVHISLILFIAGFIISSYCGFRDSSFRVAEGETREVQNGTGLSLSLESFTDEYWENGAPRDYRSQVILLKNGCEVKQGLIQVNHPLSYEGVRFYQSFFGDTAKISFKDSQGKLIYNGQVLLSEYIDYGQYRRAAGYAHLPQNGSIVFVLSKVDAADTGLADNQVLLEVYQGNSDTPAVSHIISANETYKAGGLEINYSGRGRFSGFQVSRDPGNSLIWIAAALLLAGLIAIFFFPASRIYGIMQSSAGGLENKLYLRCETGRKMRHQAEIKRLSAIIKRELA